MDEPPPPGTTRAHHDRSGAWAGAWVVSYASVSAAWWGTTLLALGALHSLADLGVRWSEMLDQDGDASEAQQALAEVVRRAPEAVGEDVWPLAAAGAVLAFLLVVAGGGVLCRSAFARVAAVAMLAGMGLVAIAYTAVVVLVVHPERTRWMRALDQALTDLRTAGANVDADVLDALSQDPVTAAVVEVCLQGLHLAVLGLLVWAVLRRGTKRWCERARGAA